ncbi:hypothetical protein PTSG_05743 [Salpingoeca rosetta]|uniref:COMM domain-containing protein 5 n=1 Tax=Salpingoeca rosetta (strain ATCC 50818 / BSB-021) TaxID=946362 RepID=F2UB37_SALR5|nr:uncharacterized protein PTSG_05743 [Salpingoeca rosetta]EGD74050.1 hypothetical protein PTSG_05743 [Salpingoeca rosetta]|eukprot:XP_004993612.1 hypothetical protein PTSG_05743 [Salpingoeca rosetta]
MNRVDASAFRQGGEVRDTFFGPRVPPLVKALFAHANVKAASACFKATLAAVRDQETPHLDELAETLGATQDEVQRLLAGAHALISAVTQIPPTRLKPRSLEEDLDYLQAPPALKKLVMRLAFKDRPDPAEHSSLPSLDQLKWRVDVAISTSSLKRVLQPSVLMQMRLSDGTLRTFEVPVHKFHELRYNTAFALKEMIEVAAKPAVQGAAPPAH